MSTAPVQKIRSHLIETFNGHLDMADARARPRAAREVMFLSRALAAFALMRVCGASRSEAAHAITDGNGDNGIDAVFYDRVDKILYLVHAEWPQGRRTSVSRWNVQQFLEGVLNLTYPRYEGFNSKIKQRAGEIEHALLNEDTTVCLMVVHTGQGALDEGVLYDVDNFLDDQNDGAEVMMFKHLAMEDLLFLLGEEPTEASINVEVRLNEWGQTMEPYSAYYGQVSAKDLARWFDTYGQALFAPNIRMYMGGTAVNQTIADTLLNEPYNFWYFNNGITVLCEAILPKDESPNARHAAIFECHGITVVNGAQTVGVIARVNRRFPEAVAGAQVLVRFISLAGCPPDFAADVTRATNTQNRIERRDFVSLDPTQARLRAELRREGIHYAYKSGDKVVDRSRAFDVVEATVALAVAYGEVTYAVQVKSNIGEIWDGVDKPIYKHLFNEDITGKYLWQTVQVFRMIDDQLALRQEHFSENENPRLKLMTVHGNRFLAYLVFKHLRLLNVYEQATDSHELHQHIVALLDDAIMHTATTYHDLFPDGYIGNTFKNRTKCRQLDEVISINW